MVCVKYLCREFSASGLWNAIFTDCFVKNRKTTEWPTVDRSDVFHSGDLLTVRRRVLVDR